MTKEIMGRYLDYQCSEGHWMSSPWPEARVMKEGCPVYVRGKRCIGTLKRVGEGSRKEKA